MDYTDDLSDYSEDFEEEDSSKGGNGPSKAPEVTTTPKRPPISVHNRTDPGQRKARSHYNPSVSKAKNWKLGKRALSEKPFLRGTPFSPRDRELSAKVHTIKKLQNQLSDCQRELTDAKKENKLLTRLQVRQERELTRVQTQEGELPQILARHSEEIRVLKEQLKRSNESSQTHQTKVSSLNDEILRLKNRGKKLEQVAKRKNLLERESLTKQLQEAKNEAESKEKKLKEMEKGMETLNKTHGQEIKALLQKNRTLTQDLETARERAQKMHTQLKERAKEMEVMNIYSQRMGRSTLNNSLRLQADMSGTEDTFSQTDLTCPPNKNISMQTKPTLKSSSSQTQVTPIKTLETRTTQTDITPVNKTRVPSPTVQSPPPVSHPKATSPPPPVHNTPTKQPTEPKIKSPPTVPEAPQPQEPGEEQKRKNLLLSRLKALDGQKGPPASQPAASLTHNTSTAEIQGPTTAPQSTATAQATTTEVRPSAKALSPPITQKPVKEDEEAKKKKLLLAKLMAIDEGGDPKNVTISKMNVSSEPAPPSLRSLSGHSNNSIQSWQAETVDNLHKGKPAFFTDQDPFGSRHSSGKKNSGLTKSKGSAKAPKDATNTQGYKPSFGRRARATDAGPLNSIFSDSEGAMRSYADTKGAKSTGLFNGDFDSDKPAAEDSLGLFDDNNQAGKDYPWEKRVNLDSKSRNTLQGPGNQSMVFGPMSKTPLLPLRQKAEANRVDVMPGGIAEPDDIEELVL